MKTKLWILFQIRSTFERCIQHFTSSEDVEQSEKIKAKCSTEFGKYLNAISEFKTCREHEKILRKKINLRRNYENKNDSESNLRGSTSQPSYDGDPKYDILDNGDSQLSGMEGASYHI